MGEKNSLPTSVCVNRVSENYFGIWVLRSRSMTLRGIINYDLKVWTRYSIHRTALLDVYRLSSIFFPPQPLSYHPRAALFLPAKNLIDSKRPVHLQRAANVRVKLGLPRSFYEEYRNDGSVALRSESIASWYMFTAGTLCTGKLRIANLKCYRDTFTTFY